MLWRAGRGSEDQRRGDSEASMSQGQLGINFHTCYFQAKLRFFVLFFSVAAKEFALTCQNMDIL